MGMSLGTVCGLKEDCLDMLMSAWMLEGRDEMNGSRGPLRSL